jgi:Uma2 family endonuclease
MAVASRVFAPIVYPETDGKPMAENTLQFDWIVKLKTNVDALLPDFVAGDLFWYPVEGHPEIVYAPDVMVALGRPKGPRKSYRQWEEEGIAPQVVMEVWSPSNRWPEKSRKLMFYEKYGVQEYYAWDPEQQELTIHLRRGEVLEEVQAVDGWVSPLLGIRFVFGAEDLEIYNPDGTPFLSPEELRASAEEQRVRAEEQRVRAEQQSLRADQAERELKALKERLAAMGVVL